jgi:hypothetical protein
MTFLLGIAPKGTNTDLLQHVSTNSAESIYVSTSRLFNIAFDFAGKNGYIYVIRTSRGIDINATLGGRSPFPEQQEVAIPGGVLASELFGAFSKQKGELSEIFIPNPNYRGR